MQYMSGIVIPTLVVMDLSCLLEEQHLEPALNLMVHCCGLEFRVLTVMIRILRDDRGLICCVSNLIDEELSLNYVNRHHMSCGARVTVSSHRGKSVAGSRRIIWDHHTNDAYQIELSEVLWISKC
ncbi:hypothetical protein Tco_0250660 [Tanacetum coccineum]|uniref:Uncharacterized protein n=1 Tax=Tanacetum coccineum TaxID=301880 RepID=A0ABQ4XVT8_9ASTR